MLTFLRFTTIVLCLALASCDRTAYKRDVLGIYTGMTITDALKVIQSQGGRCDPIDRSFTIGTSCVLPKLGNAVINFSTNSKYSDKICYLGYSIGKLLDTTTIAYIVKTYSLTQINNNGDYPGEGLYQMPTGEHMTIGHGGFSISDDALANSELANPGSSYVPPKL